MMRRTWPTMLLTGTALVSVLLVLLLTGARSDRAAGFALTTAPTTVTVVPGGSAEFQVRVIGIGDFRGSVGLTTSVLPDGITAGFDQQQVTVRPGRSTASSTLTVRIGASRQPGTLSLGVAATVGRQLVTSNLIMQIAPATITDAGPPPVPAPVRPMLTPITGTATLRGTVRIGVRMPIAVTLDNPHRHSIALRELRLSVLSTSSPRCLPSYFVIVPYAGGQVRLPPGQARTLASMHVLAGRWPQLVSVRSGCAGVSVRLKLLGNGVLG